MTKYRETYGVLVIGFWVALHASSAEAQTRSLQPIIHSAYHGRRPQDVLDDASVARIASESGLVVRLPQSFSPLWELPVDGYIDAAAGPGEYTIEFAYDSRCGGVRVCTAGVLAADRHDHRLEGQPVRLSLGIEGRYIRPRHPSEAPAIVWNQDGIHYRLVPALAVPFPRAREALVELANSVISGRVVR